MADEILDEIWRVRAELLTQYGGLHGLVKHLQAMDRARINKRHRRKQTRTNAARNGRAGSRKRIVTNASAAAK